MPTTLARVLPMIISLLNAAGWKNHLIGSINAGSSALTVADAVFTADDVGKKIAIDGAGDNFGIYEGEILSFVDATHVTIFPAVISTQFGTTVSYGGRLNDDRRNLFELREGAFQADEAHYLPLAESTGHWLRPELLILSEAIDHAAELGAVIPRIGPLGRVYIRVHPLGDYEPAQRASAEEVKRLRANVGNVYGSLAHNVAGSLIGGYFWMPADENTVQYTGDSLKLYYVPTYTRGADLKSPEIFTGSIASFTVARLLAKEGAKTPGHATVHGAYSEAVIAGIRANETKIPATVEEFQQETPPARAA